MELKALRAALNEHFGHTDTEAVEQFINHSLEALAIKSKEPESERVP